jgi:hypothetical protein
MFSAPSNRLVRLGNVANAAQTLRSLREMFLATIATEPQRPQTFLLDRKFFSRYCLFMPKRLDRIQAGGFPGWEKSENDPYGAGKKK